MQEESARLEVLRMQDEVMRASLHLPDDLSRFKDRVVSSCECGRLQEFVHEKFFQIQCCSQIEHRLVLDQSSKE